MTIHYMAAQNGFSTRTPEQIIFQNIVSQKFYMKYRCRNRFTTTAACPRNCHRLKPLEQIINFPFFLSRTERGKEKVRANRYKKMSDHVTPVYCTKSISYGSAVLLTSAHNAQYLRSKRNNLLNKLIVRPFCTSFFSSVAMLPCTFTIREAQPPCVLPFIFC